MGFGAKSLEFIGDFETYKRIYKISDFPTPNIKCSPDFQVSGAICEDDGKWNCKNYQRQKFRKFSNLVGGKRAKSQNVALTIEPAYYLKNVPHKKKQFFFNFLKCEIRDYAEFGGTCLQGKLNSSWNLSKAF